MRLHTTDPNAITIDERAMLLRLAVADKPWTQLTDRTVETAESLAANGLANIIRSQGRRYVGIVDDAGELLAALAANPPATLSPAERRNLATYRHQAAEVGMSPTR